MVHNSSCWVQNCTGIPQFPKTYGDGGITVFFCEVHKERVLGEGVTGQRFSFEVI